MSNITSLCSLRWVLALGLLTSCTHGSEVALVDAPGAEACSALTAPVLVGEDLRILSATFVPASEKHAANCLIDAEINPRIGVDGQRYAIGIRMRLPTENWNGDLYSNGGGGINGQIADPEEMTLLGYATLATDSGHDAVQNARDEAGGSAAFGLDPGARTDFAYRAYDITARAGKALIEQYYGTPTEHAYHVGCSEGGREGLILAQRYPEHYDGIIAGAPVLHLPLGPMAGVYTTQVFANLANQLGHMTQEGTPDLAQTFSNPDLMLARGAVLNACDALDGLADGMVLNLEACTSELVRPALEATICTSGKTASCLHAAQVEALQLAFAGPVNSAGDALYSDWPWDGGISGFDGDSYNGAWRSWWLGRGGENPALPIKMVYAPALAVLYSTPPQVPISTGDALAYSLSYDFDRDPALIYATDEDFEESAAASMFADHTDLSGFANAGGKLIVYHGASDASVSMNDTRNWFRQAMADTPAGLDNSARMFLIPGLGHCGGGPATDRFDLFPRLVEWVEGGAAPERVEAEASRPGYFGAEARTRPLCAYPTQAYYDGSGDIDDAASFVCR